MTESTTPFFGLLSVRAVLGARLRTPYELWVCEDSSVRGLARLIQDAQAAGIPVNVRPKAFLDQHFGQSVSDVALEAGPRADLSPDALLQSLQPKTSHWVLALEGVDDPHQLGASLRTAAAVGVSAVILTRSIDDLDPDTIARASAGTSESINLCVTQDLPGLLGRLAAEGFGMLAADAEAQQSLFDVSLVGKVGFVIGGRRRGLSSAVRQACSGLVRLPMEGQVPSLTVASACSAMLYEAYRQRHRPR